MPIELTAQGAEPASDPCGATADFICDWVYDVTGNERLSEAADWFIERPLKVALILFVAFLLNRWVRRVIARGVERMLRDREEQRLVREQQEVEDGRFASLQQKAIDKARLLTHSTERSMQRAQTLGTVLQSIASGVIYTFAILIALSEFDISLGPLIAGAGIAGVALGFGAQTIVRDFLSGIFMIIEDQYGVGDVVDLGEATGVVEEISLRTTRIRDVNGKVWHYPNGEIRRVGNLSQIWARSVLDVEVAYGTDLDLASRVIKEAADSVWRDNLEDATILEEPEIWGVQELGNSAIAIRLVTKTEPGEQWATARELRRRIKDRFDAVGIEIPFPQRTVWLRSEDADPETPDA